MAGVVQDILTGWLIMPGWRQDIPWMCRAYLLIANTEAYILYSPTFIALAGIVTGWAQTGKTRQLVPAPGKN